MSAFFNEIIWCWWDKSDVSVNQHSTSFDSLLTTATFGIKCSDWGADMPTLTTLCCQCLLSVQVQLAWGLFVMHDMIRQHWLENLSEENRRENILLPLSHTTYYQSTHITVSISLLNSIKLSVFCCNISENHISKASLWISICLSALNLAYLSWFKCNLVQCFNI